MDCCPLFREHHGTAGVGPSQEGLPVCFGSFLPPYSTPGAVREEELGQIPAGHRAGLAQPNPKGLHSESGLWPQGRAWRWASQCRGLSWGSQGPQSTNELPPPQEWLQVQSHTRSTVRTKDLRMQSPCPTAPWMPPVLGSSAFLAGWGGSWQVGGVPPNSPVSPALPPALLGQGFACLILLYQSPGQWGQTCWGGGGLPQLNQTTVSKSSDVSSQRSSPSQLH